MCECECVCVCVCVVYLSVDVSFTHSHSHTHTHTHTHTPEPEWLEYIGDARRLAWFRRAVASLPESQRRIAVVAHFGFINLIVMEDGHVQCHKPDFAAFPFQHMSNATWVKTVWEMPR